MTCCVIVDYGSGNLHSAEKSFQRMAADRPFTEIRVTGDPEAVIRADMIVLPGVGAFAACRQALADRKGLVEALFEAARDRAVPFFGICVGMQMMATVGTERGATCAGLDWIPGEVIPLATNDVTLRLPHMGWNAFDSCATEHPVFAGLAPGDHAYFVHSYHLRPRDPRHVLAQATHGETFAAAVGFDNIVGTQFHPEKSQATGLRIIGNFLGWRP
ncbi:MAG: imidazole glycerol phosphate synthase subunit HisH [Paracoccaceae bacterium]|nr:imidazole glycerol phosphate synthase subunit HisH [Paracoccaceae bacterium]